MHVIAFNGSPRPHGTTSRMLRQLFKPLEDAGISTEEVLIGGNKVRGCRSCFKCWERDMPRCIFDDDPVNGWIDKMVQADGIILASPTYFANLTTEMKALIDRGGLSLRNRLYRKVGAPVVVARRGGAMQTYNALMSFFGIKQMIVPMSSYWNMGYGMAPGDVDQDQEALDTMTNLGTNMAWLLQRLHA